MVADHAAEPAKLLALMRDVVADVGRRHHGGRDRPRRASLPGGGVHDRGAGPLQDLGIGKLKHEAVRVAPDAVEGAGTVSGPPHREVPAPLQPREPDLGPVVVDRVARHQALDHMHGLGHLGQGPGFAPDYPQCRIAPSDAADGARAVGVVQRREGRGEHGPVARARVGDHRTDDDPLGLGQDPGEDDERLLPQHVRVEHPHVCEAVRLGPLGEIDHAPGRRIGLQYDAEVHPSHSVIPRPGLFPHIRPRGGALPSRLPAYQGTGPASTTGGLARISHQVTAAGADLIKHPLATQAWYVFAALNAARVLDVLASTPARPDSRSPCENSHLHALARNLVRNAG